MSLYAESLMFSDTRKGVRTLGLVSMFMLSVSALAYALLGFDPVYVHSSVVLAALSLHVAIASRVVRETRALYMLGTTLVLVSGVAFVLLAHHSESLNASLFAGVMLLFIIMPLVPWGLREAILIVALVYGMFTLSTLSVEGRFEENTLWVLQLMILGGSATTLIVVARNALIRREDIQARFELEQAHDHMEALSLRDPLTGAWNRRFLDQNFIRVRDQAIRSNTGLQFALIDIDDFKQINDTCGHDFGDEVLRRVVNEFQRVIDQSDYLVRVGGDEFLLLMSHTDTVSRINQALNCLMEAPRMQASKFNALSKIGISVGLVSSVFPDQTLTDLYRAADQALYRSKSEKARTERSNIHVYRNEGGGNESVA